MKCERQCEVSTTMRWERRLRLCGKAGFGPRVEADSKAMLFASLVARAKELVPACMRLVMRTIRYAAVLRSAGLRENLTLEMSTKGTGHDVSHEWTVVRRAFLKSCIFHRPVLFCSHKIITQRQSNRGQVRSLKKPNPLQTPKTCQMTNSPPKPHRINNKK
jgi:hypothetical protein